MPRGTSQTHQGIIAAPRHYRSNRVEKAFRARGSRSAKEQTITFLHSDPCGKPPAESRKFIRSHVMKGKNKKRRQPRDSQSLSWIHDSLLSQTEEGSEFINITFDDKSTQVGDKVGKERRPLTTGSSSLMATRYQGLGVRKLIVCLQGPVRAPGELTLVKFPIEVDHRTRSLLTFCKQLLFHH